MKFLNKIAFFTILFCLACLFVVNAEEDAPAKRPNILLRRPNPQRGGPLGNKAAGGAVPAAAAATTSTTSEPKSHSGEETDEYDQNEEVDGEHGSDKVEEAAAQPTTSTTTEPAKKIGPIIRPFRSNDDLLSALKRRQQNSKKGVSHKVEKPTVKASEPEEEKDESAPAPAAQPIQKATDRNARRNKFTAKKTAPSATNADSEDANNEQQQATSPVVKRPGRFNLKTLKSK